jgi:hypothetical protein
VTNLGMVLDYAKRGWHVFPLQPQDKIPLSRSRGFKDATTNPTTLKRWFGCGYPYNIGIRTGIASGVFVFDPDGNLGAESHRALERQYGPLPLTLISLTGNGRHYWFRADQEIPSTGKNKVAPNIDIKAEGGYVVAPPSIHPNGKTYRWLNHVPPAPAPAWLIKLIHHARTKPAPPLILPPKPPLLAPPRIISASSVSSAAYGNAALDREIRGLVLASSGARNHALNRASFVLYQLVGGQELHAGHVHHRLIEAAKANGLLGENGLRAVQATINSGATAGLRNPRGRR